MSLVSPVPIALVNNAVTPYRVALHSRLVREMPEVQLWSVFTHEVSNSDWRLPVPAALRPVFFGPGERSLDSDHGSAQIREWRKGGRIIRWLRENRIGAVVLGGYSDAARLRILAWSRWNRIPCFLFGDSNTRCDQAPWIKRLVLPLFLRLCNGVLCCGRLGEDYFVRYGVPRRCCFRFPYEPDYEIIRNVPDEGVELIHRTFGLRKDRKYIIYSGRLIRIKRVDLLLSAFSRIADRRPEWNLIIAGDGCERSSLEEHCRRGSAPDRVIWTGFLNDSARLAALYAASSLLVLPSDFEPWGIVVTEAAVRMPVVASSVVGAAADVVRDGVNGRIFAAGSLDSLTECLLDVTDSDRLGRMTAAAASCFSAWHSASDPVAGLRQALGSVNLI